MAGQVRVTGGQAETCYWCSLVFFRVHRACADLASGAHKNNSHPQVHVDVYDGIISTEQSYRYKTTTNVTRKLDGTEVNGVT